jgi:hypothetical protein
MKHIPLRRSRRKSVVDRRSEAEAMIAALSLAAAESPEPAAAESPEPNRGFEVEPSTVSESQPCVVSEVKASADVHMLAAEVMIEPHLPSDDVLPTVSESLPSTAASEGPRNVASETIAVEVVTTPAVSDEEPTLLTTEYLKEACINVFTATNTCTCHIEDVTMLAVMEEVYALARGISYFHG